VWDSAADIGVGGSPAMRIRITPSDTAFPAIIGPPFLHTPLLVYNDDAKEENDSATSPAVVVAGTEPNLAVVAGDDDWYSVTAPADRNVEALVAYDQSKGNVQLEMWDATGTTRLAASLSPGGVDVVSQYTTTGDTFLVRVFIAAGVNSYQMTVGIQPPLSADRVLGKSTFTEPNTLAYGLRVPAGVSKSGSTTVVADTLNHRVLIYSSIGGDHPAAAIVLGQADMFGSLSNRGGSCGAGTLSGPTDVAIDGTTLIVADTGNHRVLIWNTIPTANGVSADRVLGQSGFTTNTANRGSSVSASTLSAPKGVSVGSRGILVADSGNHRVLSWDSKSVSNGAAAADLLGQKTFTTNQANNDDPGLFGFGVVTGVNAPIDAEWSGNNVVVIDTQNHRALVFDGGPAVFPDKEADAVLGQSGLAGKSPNRGLSAPTAATLSTPTRLSVAGTAVWVTDTGNNRVLRYALALTTGKAAAEVVGQSDFTGSTAHAFGVNRADLGLPSGVAATGTTLAIADPLGHRVLMWDSLVDSFGSDCTYLIGHDLQWSTEANDNIVEGQCSTAVPEACSRSRSVASV
jgi:hypothetical protein